MENVSGSPADVVHDTVISPAEETVVFGLLTVSAWTKGRTRRETKANMVDGVWVVGRPKTISHCI